MKGLTLDKNSVEVVDVATTAPNATKESTELVAFDMSKTKNEIVKKFTREELAEITDQIDITDTNTIIMFGKSAADEISKCSDSVLNMVEMDQINRTGAMLTTLTKIMTSFDMGELVDHKDENKKKKGFLSRLVGSTREQLEGIIKKYDTLGGQLDKICVQLRQYESEIASSNDKLEDLFNANIAYYKELERYIAACSIGYEMLDDYRATLEKQGLETDDQTIRFKIQNVDMAKQMLQQRELDLRAAENIAMQSLPMLKTMQFSNLNLNRKINSAFIITIPIFKQNIAQAVLLKRQRLQAEALAALDKTTNDMLIKNAQNAADQARFITNLASTSSIKVETLEQTHAIIMQGIQDCNNIMKDSAKQRETDIRKLVTLKQKAIEEKI